MTTTNTYNPLLSAFRILTTPQAFRWYGTQAKATATLAPAIAEPENAKAPHQEYAQAEAIVLEPDFGEAELSVDAVPLDDDDDTELRYWAELELPSILVEEYPPMEDDADNSTAGGRS
jgi:hypothetical protein